MQLLRIIYGNFNSRASNNFNSANNYWRYHKVTTDVINKRISLSVRKPILLQTVTQYCTR